MAYALGSDMACNHAQHDLSLYLCIPTQHHANFNINTTLFMLQNKYSIIYVSTLTQRHLFEVKDTIYTQYGHGTIRASKVSEVAP